MLATYKQTCATHTTTPSASADAFCFVVDIDGDFAYSFACFRCTHTQNFCVKPFVK